MSLFQIDAGREWRGGQRQVLLLAREIHAAGYPSHLVVQPGSPLHNRAREEGLPVIPVRMRSEADPLAVARLALEMKRRRCRLVHYHDAHSISVGQAAAGIVKVPLRFISRRVDFPIGDSPLSRRKYTKDVDRIIAVSTGVEKVLVDGGVDPGRIAVIPDGIDLTPFEGIEKSDYLHKELGFKKSDFLVGIVAHLADHKGHKYLIRATRLLADHPRIKVIIVGEGPLKMELTRQAEDDEVRDMVFFLGFREDIPRILASLDVFVLSSYLEGMGSSLLDAMACRLPMVATRVGGIPDVVEDGVNGFLVPARSPEALAKALLRLYEDRKLGRRLGEEGHRIVHSRFSAEAMARRVVALYEETARKKGVRLHG